MSEFDIRKIGYNELLTLTNPLHLHKITKRKHGNYIEIVWCQLNTLTTNHVK